MVNWWGLIRIPEGDEVRGCSRERGPETQIYVKTKSLSGNLRSTY
jgi:hypothetical protein